MPAHQRSQRMHRAVVQAQRDLGLEPHHIGLQPQLTQSTRRRAQRPDVLRLAEGFATPHRGRGDRLVARGGVGAGGEQAAGTGHQPLEADRVDRLAGCAQPVPGDGPQDRHLQRPPQP